VLLPPDERRLDAALMAAVPETGWRCVHPGLAPAERYHVHPSLVAALSCPVRRTGASLYLPFGAAVPAGLGDQRAHRADRPVGLTTISYRCTQVTPDPVTRHSMRAGGLRVSWRPVDVGEAADALLVEQVALVWEAVKEATAAVTLTWPGAAGTVSDVRVGEAAHARLVAGASIARSSSERLRLV